MLVSAYLARLALSSFRPTTISLRRRVLQNLEHHLAPRGLADATRHDLEAFIARPLAPGSRRVYRSCIRHFYAWACEEGLLSTNPAEKIPPIRVAHGTPRPVDDDSLRLALSRADARMRAWLLLMALAGLRCMEVAALNPAALMRTENGWLLYLSETKGGAPATVPAHPAIVDALVTLPVTGSLWWSCTGKHVSQFTAAYLRSLGVNATAHQLRHTAGTTWLRESGHDLITTAVLMRHKSVATTQVYTALDPVRPAAVVAAVRNPLVIDLPAQRTHSAECPAGRRAGGLYVAEWAAGAPT